VVLTGSDAEGGALTFSIVTNPAHGGLIGAAPNLTYTPTPGYYGVDSFSYIASDGQMNSAPATVTINIQHVNRAPVGFDQSIATLMEQSVSVILKGSDSDGDSLAFSIKSGPGHGSLSGTPPTLVYTPASGFYGSDAFSYEVSDGALSAIATVFVSVNWVNRPPSADAKTIETFENQPVEIALSGSDPDAGMQMQTNLSFAIATAPSHGSLTGSAPNFTYTPTSGYVGSDSFTYVANDGALNSAPATVRITIHDVNHAPLALAQSVATLMEKSAPVTLQGSDPDGDALVFQIRSGPTHGTLSGTVPNLTYTPADGFYGSDAFTYQVTDGALTSTAATVSITVQFVNSAPVADAKVITTVANQPVPVTLSGTDADGDVLQFSIASGPSNGTLSGVSPNLIYTPREGFSGTELFTYTATDGTASTGVATVSVTVNQENRQPNAFNQTIKTTRDQSVGIVLTAQDPDGNPVTFLIVRQPRRGTLSGTAPYVTYHPAPGVSGNDSFTFKVSDGQLTSSEATVNISITSNWVKVRRK
jgi:hypothetical protein